MRDKINYILGVLLTIVIIVAVVLASVTAKNGSQNGNYSEGIDVSSHNGEIDWHTVAKHTDFAIIRAGYRGYGEEGIINEDKYFAENLKNALNENLPIGVYFYTQSISEEEAEAEAEFVINLLGKSKLDLPVFIDFEYPYDDKGNPTGRMHGANLTREQATANINAFCKKIEKAGYKSGVYSSSNVYNFHLNADDFGRNTCIWVADYNNNVKFNGEYQIWQYSKTGSCNGVNSKYCDMNRWYK